MLKGAEVVERMMSQDAFSQWLGISVLECAEGMCKLQMTVNGHMTNGFGVAHGGITYALADSALAFASNSHGLQSMSIETAISHTRPVNEGDILQAVARELHLGRKTGIYEVVVQNQEGKVVALFKGTVFRTEKEW